MNLYIWLALLSDLWMGQHPIWQRQGRSSLYRNREEGWGKEAIRGKKKLFWGAPGHLCFCLCFERRRPGKGFVMQIASSFWGLVGEGRRRPTWQTASSVSPRKFHIGGLRLCSWESLAQKLAQVLNLGLVSWALAQVTPFWACGFLFNCPHYENYVQQSLGTAILKC